MSNDDLSALKIDKSAPIKGSGGKRKNHWFYLVMTASFLILSVVLYGKGYLKPTVSINAVTVSQIYPSQTFTILNSSGYVVAQRKAALASKMTGRLVSLSVKEGDHVTKGQVVARLENEDTQANVNISIANSDTAKANLEQAKTELSLSTLAYKRYKNLVDIGCVSRSEYDIAEARYQKDRAAVRASESMVRSSEASRQAASVANRYSMISAPFDGVVTTKNADIGDIITPLGAASNAKAAVITIADMDSLQVETDVSESNLATVKEGQPCEIQIDAVPNRRLRGVVKTIVPTGDRSKASVMVKIGFLENDPRILPELSAKVAFLSHPTGEEEQKPFTAVNEKAIVSHSQTKTVFLIKGDRVVETAVTTGTSFGEMIEIKSGLNAGDKIAIQPLDLLRDNSRIKTGEK